VLPRTNRLQKSDECAVTSTRLHQYTNLPLKVVEPKPVDRIPRDDSRVSRVPARRGRTMVEILSRIGDTSYPTEASTSPTHDEPADQEEEPCSVSITVDLLDDCRRLTTSGSDSNLQATISGFGREGSAVHTANVNAESFLASTQHGRSRTPVARLLVGFGLRIGTRTEVTALGGVGSRS